MVALECLLRELTADMQTGNTQGLKALEVTGSIMGWSMLLNRREHTAKVHKVGHYSIVQSMPLCDSDT